MLRIGLTGGIGAGKSAVAHRLAEHGAIVVDSDRIAREVVEPGTPGLAAVVAEFGAEVLRADGSLDRDRLGALVFGDDAARSRLNAIVHPLVGRRAAELAAAAPEGAVLVHDIPLLVENNLAAGFDLVLVVEAPVELRVARLVRDRGMTEEAARARIAAQASDAERRAVADVLLHNDGTLAELHEQVDKVWTEIEARRAAG
jgi:dephospho-CoA kinase